MKPQDKDIFLMPTKNKTRIIASIIYLTSTQILFNNCSAIKQSYSTQEYTASSSDSLALKLQGPGAASLRRMSNIEYINSLKHAVEIQFKRRSSANNFATEIFQYRGGDSILQTVPSDTRDTNVSTNQVAANLTASKFDAYLKVSRTVGKIIADDLNFLKAFAGSCVSDKTDISNQVCVDQFINEFGLIVFRAPVNPTELAEIKKGATDWNSLISRLLVHPRFLVPYFRAGTKVGGSDIYELSNYEIEAKLTSVFWKSLPDLVGLQAAEKGLLKTEAGLRSEIQRILDSPKAEAMMWEFYKQWLGESRIPGDMRLGQEFNLITGFNFDNDTNKNGPYLQGIRDDANEFLSYLTWKQKAKLETLFTSPLLFPRQTDVALVYGVTARTSITDPPITDQTGNYKGILSRPFITVQKPGSYGSINPIQRGYLLALNVMGIKLGKPVNFGEQNAVIVPPEASTSHETRLKTNTAACISCHSVINPAGFALANYNAVGKYMTIEKRYKQATLVASNPVDAKSNLTLGGKYYQIDGLGSFVDAMIDSGQLVTGFSNYYFEFTQGRSASPDDQSWINRFKSSLRNKSLYDALTDYGMDKDFARVRAK